MSVNRREVIITQMQSELAAEDLSDTWQNRYPFLQGLQAAWNEDPDSSFEKTLWELALTLEIQMTLIKIQTNAPQP